MMRFGAFVVKGILMWILAHLQMNHGSTNAHVQRFSCWENGADDHDITM